MESPWRTWFRAPILRDSAVDTVHIGHQHYPDSGRTRKTTDYNQMSLAEHGSTAMLLGAFAVSILHNIVHLLFGVAGVVTARATNSANWYLIVGGVVCLVLWLYGLPSNANFVPANTADNWLHFGLGVGMIVLGLVTGHAALSQREARV